ncbi:hypothetical protein SUDANB60_06245 (plasmid) [Streptomyces sp. enrichment culture]
MSGGQREATLGPQNAHRSSLPLGVGDDVSGAAVGPGRAAVPHGEQFVDEPDEDLAARHMGVGVGHAQAGLMNVARQVDQPVVGGVVPVGKPVAVLGGGDDGLEAAAVVEDRLGPPRVRTVGEAGDPELVVGGAGGGLNQPQVRLDGVLKVLGGCGAVEPSSRR